MKVLTVNALVAASHKYGLERGFWNDFRFAVPPNCRPQLLASKLMLVVCEAAEAVEALRNGDAANLTEELADIMLRVADLAGYLEIDLEAALYAKMKTNANREFKHGKRF